MSRTKRRRPWYPEGLAITGKDRWRKVCSDKTCEPGCWACGHDRRQHKVDETRSRRQGRTHAVEGYNSQHELKIEALSEWQGMR